MAITSDIMGLGTAPALAGKLGHALSTSALPGGASQGAAVGIPTSASIINPAAGVANYILPTGASLAKEYYVANPTAVAATIYPPVGGTINGNAANAAFTAAANSLSKFIAFGPLTWFAK